jgi:hypothetical protein
VTARGTVHGKPVAFTKLRVTYNHEADSALGFVALNDPNSIKGPADFKRAASKIGFTFNWFYIDRDHIAYFNSGNNPVRPARTSTNFPVSSRFEWKNWDPNLSMAKYYPPRTHPQVTDQAYLANWNNKQARGTRAADDNFGYGSIYRSQSLSDRIKSGIRGSKKMSIPQLIDAMESAGTVDLRATKVLPYALRMLGHPRNPRIRHAVGVLRAWVRSAGTGSTATTTAPTSTRRRSRSSTAGGRSGSAPSSCPQWARSCTAAPRASSRSTTTRTWTASTTARRTRWAGTATPRRTCGVCWAAGCVDRCRASIAAARSRARARATSASRGYVPR